MRGQPYHNMGVALFGVDPGRARTLFMAAFVEDARRDGGIPNSLAAEALKLGYDWDLNALTALGVSDQAKPATTYRVRTGQLR